MKEDAVTLLERKLRAMRLNESQVHQVMDLLTECLCGDCLKHIDGNRDSIERIIGEA